MSIIDVIDGTLDGRVLCDMSPQIQRDLGKVEFDLENFRADLSFSSIAVTDDTFMGLQFCNELAFYGCCAGGDWESPIYFIFYWDGKHVRAYIPANGNTWSKLHKSAYGNHDDTPADDAPRVETVDMLRDIQLRIVVK